jgi:hypothetical protein
MMPISISPLSKSGIHALGPLYGCTLAAIGVVLLAMAASAEAIACAPVPAGLVPMAMVRGNASLLLAVGPQSSLAPALGVSPAVKRIANISTEQFL